LGHARGSLLEMQTQLAISLDLGYLSDIDFNRLEEQSAEVLRLINGLLESLRIRAAAG